MANNNTKNSIFSPILSGLLSAYLKLVYGTSRKIFEPPDYHDVMYEKHPYICSMWHGQFLMLPPLKPPNLKTSIMVAKHGDGDVIGGTLEHFGMKLVRGGGAGHRKRDRGGMRALRESVRLLQNDNTLGMTADVPPGPARKVGLGIITIARISGRPILPAATATSHFHAFNTWSRMTLNLPFSKLSFVLGDPIIVPRDATPDELEQYRAQLETAMHQVTERAYELVGRDVSEIQPYDPVATTSNTSGERPPITLPLKLYRAATTAFSFLAPYILKKREESRKEDPARRNERLGNPKTPRPDGPLIWFHAASVGETNAILPLIPEIKKQRPDATLLLTTGTVTSAHLAAQRLGEDAIHQYIPLDFRKFMRNFLEHWQPDLAVLAESEIWPNLILETSEANIPLLLVNARMSKKSYRSWKRYGYISRPLFSRLDHVLAQTDRIADWYRILGSFKVQTSGNLKIDAPPPPSDPDKERDLRAAIGARPVFLAASTHPGEDEIIARAHRKIERTIPELLTIIAPRHPERGISIAEQLREAGSKVSLRSEGDLPAAQHNFYIADTIGELGTLYSIAPIAFIGGSLIPHGGQNPIEAVKLGCVPLTGPYRQNFVQIYDTLLRAGGTLEAKSADDITEIAINLLQNESELDKIRNNAMTGLDELTGALDVTLNEIIAELPDRKE